MKKSLLLAIVGMATIGLVQGADAPTQTQTQPAAGTAAPDFSLATSDGSQVSLKDFKGKWVVLYFY
ncbi:MAG TPA: redoxin domain-containing protein, partial [Chthoniobacterales bacterium]|nr:redoxin domain-containing protein [Chthoniobacterales bacterium]